MSGWRERDPHDYVEEARLDAQSRPRGGLPGSRSEIATSTFRHINEYFFCTTVALPTKER